MNKQIKIEELIPLLKGGYVAMDKDGDDWVFITKDNFKDYELAQQTLK